MKRGPKPKKDKVKSLTIALSDVDKGRLAKVNASPTLAVRKLLDGREGK